MPRPHPLDLYRLSVQHPLAEVDFIDRLWAHYRPGHEPPLLLREDFAGTCATAGAWVACDPDRQALAVEIDEPTAQWAAERLTDPRSQADLHIVVADVMEIDEPATQITLALNFSTLIYHDEAALLGYLRHARNCLSDDGLLILDLFGPGSAPSVQTRMIEPDEFDIPAFTYRWEQRHYDPHTQRIDCRIHFEHDDGQRLTDAFVYDWRLWPMDTLLGLMHQAGFATAQAWGPPPESPPEPPPEPRSEPVAPGEAGESGELGEGQSVGRFVPLSAVPSSDHDWSVYVVGVI